MFAQLFSSFNRFQSRFTYRQRFVFFAIIFILVTPFPAYIIIKDQNILIKQEKRKILGLEHLKIVSTLFNQVIKHSILLQSSLGSQKKRLDKLETAIEAGLKNLNSLDSFDFYPLLNKWKEAIDHHDDERSFQLDQELIQKLQNSISQMKNLYDFSLNLSIFPIYLVKINLNLLPKAQIMSANLCSLISQNPNEDFLVSSLSQIYLLENNRLQVETSAGAILTNINTNKLNLSYFQKKTKEYLLYYEDFLQKMRSILYKDKTDQVIEDVVKLTLSFLQSNQEIWDVSQNILYIYYQNQLNDYYFEKALIIIIIFISSLIFAAYVFLRLVTKHFKEILYHIQMLSKGGFKKCFCSQAKDEFGPVGIALDKMSQSVQEVVDKLKKLGTQLTDSIVQITKTTKDQEEIVAEQEKTIQDIDQGAEVISSKFRDLAKTMNHLSLASKDSSLGNETKSSLDNMQLKMSELAESSLSIFNGLETIKNKVANARQLVAFMSRISDRARLLYLNAAIETATIMGPSHQGFVKITEEIQRFAENTALSIKDIQYNINEISKGATIVHDEANGYLNEIKQGGQRLASVIDELANITQQEKELIRKFESINEIMQIQDSAAESIIGLIKQLEDSTQEHSQYTRFLHRTTEELGMTAEELHLVLSLFFTMGKKDGKKKNAY